MLFYPIPRELQNTSFLVSGLSHYEHRAWCVANKPVVFIPTHTVTYLASQASELPPVPWTQTHSVPWGGVCAIAIPRHYG